MLASLTQKKPIAGQNIRPTSGFAFYSPFEGDDKGLGGPDEANGKTGPQTTASRVMKCWQM
jgi:hypothetical protein